MTGIRTKRPERGTYIGGPDACALIGVHPSKGSKDVYAQLTGTAKPAFVTDAMQRGLDKEEEAIECFLLQAGLTGAIERDIFFLDGGTKGGSCDAILTDNAGQSVLLEATTCTSKTKDNDRTWKEWQCQWYMLLSGIGKAHYFCYNIDTKQVEWSKVIHANKGKQERLMNAANKMLSHVELGLGAPDVFRGDNDADARAIESLAYEYTALTAKEKAIKESKAYLQSRISEALNGNAGFESEAIKVTVVADSVTRSVDWEKIAKELAKSFDATKMLKALEIMHTSANARKGHIKVTEKKQ